MTLRTRLFISHVLVAVMIIVCFAQLSAVHASPMVKYLATAAVLIGASLVAVRWFGQQTETLAGLELIERAIVDGEKPVGDSPFHRCAERLQSHVQRWSIAAAEGRVQTREIDTVLSMFESDPNDRRKYGSAAAKQVRFWLSSLGRDANVTLRELIACNQEIDLIGQHVTSCAQQQNDTATVATREIELLSNDVGDLACLTTKGKEAAKSTVEASQKTASQISELTDGLKELRTEISGCEHKVRSMRDHTVEIQALVHAVSENSAKADMLALNASIESVRAGELGRGFSVVADEIRKLAQQINASSLATLEQIRLVDAVVEEASDTMADKRDVLLQQEGGLAKAQESLGKVHTCTGGFEDQLDKVNTVTQAQSRRVTEIAEALEELLASSDAVRGHVVEGGWKTRSLTELISRLTDVLEPLMLSSSMDEAAFDGERGAVAQQSGDGSVKDDPSLSPDHSAAFA